MTKKMMYRIELKSMEWHIAKDIAVLAAFSNGSENKFSIGELATHAKLKNAEFSERPFAVSLIGNTLLIDKGTENLLVLTEVEICELDISQITAQEAKDILSGIPTIDTYIGIADKNNFEALN